MAVFNQNPAGDILELDSTMDWTVDSIMDWTADSKSADLYCSPEAINGNGSEQLDNAADYDVAVLLQQERFCFNSCSLGVHRGSIR